MDESRQPGARRPDLIGVVTFSGALGALVYALIKGNSKGWGSTEIVACLIGSAVLLVAFVVAETVQRDHAMFDLKLFRKPTFNGGLIAAFALSARAVRAVPVPHALHAGHPGLLAAADRACASWCCRARSCSPRPPPGRATVDGADPVPDRPRAARWSGVGLLLMRGLTESSGWTHLIPGFILAGAGVGLVNPPLASTAIGVVTPDRAGMASGINSTFRQIGIATGIAGLGSLFSHTVRTHVVSLLAGSPGARRGRAPPGRRTSPRAAAPLAAWPRCRPRRVRRRSTPCAPRS